MNRLIRQIKLPGRAARPESAHQSDARPVGYWPTILVSVLTLASVGLASALSFWAPDDSDSNEPVRRMPVRAESMEFVTSIDQIRKYTGDIRARQSSELGFELSGRISRILVDEGDHVEPGQILAVLDTRTLEARREATLASLNQSRARLSELEAGPRLETIAASRAKLKEAESALKLAELNFQRRQKLHESDAISTEEFQRAQFGLQTAQAIVDSAQKQLDELEAGTRDEQIAAQRAVVEQLQASLKETLVQIDKSSLSAPFAGRIVKRMADPGGLGLPSHPVLKLVETNQLEAMVGLPADVAVNLEVGDSVFVGVGSREYPGKIIAKIQQLEVATRTQNILIELDPVAADRVLPGQLCQIELSSPLDVTGFWVPASSLTNGIRGLWSLITVDEAGRAQRQDVEVIYTDGARVLVRGTLTGDMLVITEGTHRIVEGQHVKVLPNESESELRNPGND